MGLSRRLIDTLGGELGSLAQGPSQEGWFSQVRVTTHALEKVHHLRMGVAPSPAENVAHSGVGRVRVLDAALVAVVALVGSLLLLGAPPAPAYRHADAAAVVLVVASAATMWWWRRNPLATVLVAGLIVIANASIGYTVGVVQYPAYFGLYSVFARSPRSHRLWAVTSAGVAVVGFATADRGTLNALTIIGVGVTLLVAALLGDSVRSRRELTISQRTTIELHDRAHAAAMERLVLRERARLARELHDSVGHAINVMVMQAGVGRHVFAERPDFARAALEHVETLGRVALGELDAVLRVLRPSNGEAPSEPVSASLAGLESLCGRIRAAGREVELKVDDVDLAPSAERATYRIVQEAITNAARHTDSGRIAVSITRSNGSVVVTVHNAGPRPAPPVAGRGLVNMSERALLEGGHRRYGPVADGFEVQATLPTRQAQPK